jgi:hypothetical protein
MVIGDVVIVNAFVVFLYLIWLVVIAATSVYFLLSGQCWGLSPQRKDAHEEDPHIKQEEMPLPTDVQITP